MSVSDAALSPLEVVDLVETWSCLREMGLSVDGCKMKEVRPTEEGELEVEYRLKLAVAGTDETLKTTVHATFYRDNGGERKYAELLRRLHGQEVCSPDGGVRGFALADAEESVPGFALYVPRHRLLLESSLADNALAGLGTALDPDALTPLLTRHLAAYRLGERTRVREVEILRYKRGKRCTLRYRLETSPGSAGVSAAPGVASAALGSCPLPPASRQDGGAPSQWSLIGKVYADGEKGERIAAAMAELARNGFGRDAADGIKTPQPYGYVGELQMVLMEDVPGVPMSECLTSLEVAEHLRMAARTLAKLHRCPVTVPMTYDVEDRISHLGCGVAKVVQVCPDLAELFGKRLGSLSASAGEVHCPEPALVHGSLYPGEFFLGEGDVTIVDFDTICLGDPAVDVGNFLGHLRRKALQLGWIAEEARRLSETFLAAYQPDVPAEMMRRIDYHRRAVLLKIACRAALRPAQRHLALSLLE